MPLMNRDLIEHILRIEQHLITRDFSSHVRHASCAESGERKHLSPGGDADHLGDKIDKAMSEFPTPYSSRGCHGCKIGTYYGVGIH